MAHYVDGFVIPLPRKNLTAYRRLAQKAGKVWRDHGALDFRECVGDDLNVKMALSFPRGIKTKPGETVVENGVKVIGPRNLASEMPAPASQLYAKNLENLLGLMVTEEGALNVDFEDDIIAAACITRNGEIKNERAAK